MGSQVQRKINYNFVGTILSQLDLCIYGLYRKIFIPHMAGLYQFLSELYHWNNAREALEIIPSNKGFVTKHGENLYRLLNKFAG